MSYDISISDKKQGLLNFVVPNDVVEGTIKLVQQVMLLLLSDDGLMINFVGGQANVQALTEDVLVSETSRITETLSQTTSVLVPDSERLDELEMAFLTKDSEATYVAINISVTAVSGDSVSQIFNL